MKKGMMFEWLRPISAITGRILDEEAQMFAASEARRLMEPYVPADNLVLTQNVRVYTEQEAGIVEYELPYAHYQWQGEVYGPNYPIVRGGEVIGWCSPGHKTPTGKKLNHSKFRHPLATSHWDTAMNTARGGDLAQAVQSYLDRR